VLVDLKEGESALCRAESRGAVNYFNMTVRDISREPEKDLTWM